MAYDDQEIYGYVDEGEDISGNVESGDDIAGQFDDYIKGDPGIGIESMVQIQSASESGGMNIWRATLSDGTVHDFVVRNGLQGEQGDKGDTGETGATGAKGDPGEGIATGGTPGQVLVKASNADYATRWMSILPEDTASGSVASFPDGADDLPMGVVVDIDPVQDLHGFDNPWPGGGGKNLYNSATSPSTTESGVTCTNNGDGSFTLNGTASADAFFNIFDNQFNSNPLPSAEYRLTGVPSEAGNSDFYIYTRPSYGGDRGNGQTFTNTIIGGSIFVKSGETLNNVTIWPMIRLASNGDDTFAPYSNICPISGWTKATISHSGADTSNPTEYEIPFSTEVYGGTLNVETGELKVTHGYLTKDGTANWIRNSDGSFYCTDDDIYPAVSNDGYCNTMPFAYSSLTSYLHVWVRRPSTGMVNLLGGDIATIYPTVESLKTALSSNPLQVVYPLATPITLTLTTAEIRSLYGDNNVFADTGDVSVTYKADIQKYIDKKISAAVAAMS